ncbi:urease accessory protein UreD [Hymenobacter cellulosivorans]|uniref:Urease accessory protein UreD n=1 Tax=Hymenobacter cellulosivorans TaxID=2932249 RepID=A0ABY4F8X4_9BACT|nr:urease accessory protein UreD [Hymenobacter cellulosivorans]UOQ53125.1 urease accessory protein UreD [Hymenobacter cellulosivorans]
MNWSTVEVAQVRGQSRLITCHNLQPLKLLNPKSPTPACHVVLSSYGGGMVAGDAIRLRIGVEAGARLFVSTQANTKIFKSTNGAVAEQHVAGTVAAEALAVVFPDPVVLQAESRYRQVQHWQLHPTATLLLIDWFHSGRMDQGEQFAFTSLHSELRVSRGSRLVLLDRLTFEPEHHIAASPANFAGYQTFFSLYLVGHPESTLFQRLVARLEQQKMPGSTGPHFRISSQNYLVAVSRAKDDVYILRAAAHSRAALQPLCKQLLQELASAEMLGYNPLLRKY